MEKKLGFNNRAIRNYKATFISGKVIPKIEIMHHLTYARPHNIKAYIFVNIRRVRNTLSHSFISKVLEGYEGSQ